MAFLLPFPAACQTTCASRACDDGCQVDWHDFGAGQVFVAGSLQGHAAGQLPTLVDGAIRMGSAFLTMM